MSIYHLLTYLCLFAPNGAKATDHSTSSSSVLRCCLHLPTIVPGSHRPHFFLQVPFQAFLGRRLPMRPCDYQRGEHRTAAWSTDWQLGSILLRVCRPTTQFHFFSNGSCTGSTITTTDSTNVITISVTIITKTGIAIKVGHYIILNVLVTFFADADGSFPLVAVTS